MKSYASIAGLLLAACAGTQTEPATPSEGGGGSAAPSTEQTLGSPAEDVSLAELRGTWRLNVEESVRRLEASPRAAGESKERLHDLVRRQAARQEMVIGEAELSLSSGSRTQTITSRDVRTEGDTVIYAYSHGGADGELELTLRSDGMLDMYDADNDDVNWMVWQRAEHWELPDPLPEPQPTQPVTDEEKQAKSLETIERVGNAMLSFLIDRMDGPPLEVSQLPESWSYETEDRESEPLRRVPHADVVELLVPDYVPEVPHANPWGHSYQFAVNENLIGADVMSIRCPGRERSVRDRRLHARDVPRKGARPRHRVGGWVVDPAARAMILAAGRIRARAW